MFVNVEKHSDIHLFDYSTPSSRYSNDQKLQDEDSTDILHRAVSLLISVALCSWQICAQMAAAGTEWIWLEETHAMTHATVYCSMRGVPGGLRCVSHVTPQFLHPNSSWPVHNNKIIFLTFLFGIILVVGDIWYFSSSSPKSKRLLNVYDTSSEIQDFTKWSQMCPI